MALRYRSAASRAYFGYFKFAPLMETFALNLGNSEIAVGVGFQLSSPNAKRVWNLTCDFSFLHFASADEANLMFLRTTSIGIQTAFN